MEDARIHELVLGLQREWDDGDFEELWGLLAGRRRWTRHVRRVPGWDADDHDQLMRIVLVGAIKSWRPKRKATFATWITLCWRNRLATEIIAETVAQKRRALNEASWMTPELEESLPCPDDDAEAQKERVLDLRRRLARLMPFLSPEQHQVLLYRLAGLSYDMISARTGIGLKRVDNLLCRVKQIAKAMGA